MLPHEKAMPVVLDDPEAWDIWLTGSVEEAPELQRPFPSEGLAIVATNIRTDDQPRPSSRSDQTANSSVL
jgi:putative SOS response-associated peptidase YedK